MLRVVLEFHNIGMTVGRQHQLALCAATHTPDMLHRQNCQTGSPFAAEVFFDCNGEDRYWLLAIGSSGTYQRGKLRRLETTLLFGRVARVLLCRG